MCSTDTGLESGALAVGHQAGKLIEMRFWLRSLLICSGTVALYFLAQSTMVGRGVSPGGAKVVAALLALVFGSGLLYAALRCSACGKWACRLPGGYTTFWPGMRCRYCDRSY